MTSLSFYCDDVIIIFDVLLDNIKVEVFVISVFLWINIKFSVGGQL